jgi:hypothetical protein
MSMEQKKFFEAGRRAERDRIAWCLRKLAENVLHPSEYRDGYLQAADDVEADNLPSEWPGLAVDDGRPF